MKLQYCSDNLSHISSSHSILLSQLPCPFLFLSFSCFLLCVCDYGVKKVMGKRITNHPSTFPLLPYPFNNLFNFDSYSCSCFVHSFAFTFRKLFLSWSQLIKLIGLKLSLQKNKLTINVLIKWNGE